MNKVLNRKLMALVLGPILRAAISALTGYLTAKGLPADMVGELTNAVSALAILAFNVGWEIVDRKKSEKVGYAKAVDAIQPYEVIGNFR